MEKEGRIWETGTVQWEADRPLLHSTLTPNWALPWQAEDEVDPDRRAYAGESMCREQRCFVWTLLGLGCLGALTSE